jgi:hypothetical protein
MVALRQAAETEGQHQLSNQAKLLLEELQTSG